MFLQRSIQSIPKIITAAQISLPVLQGFVIEPFCGSHNTNISDPLDRQLLETKAKLNHLFCCCFVGWLVYFVVVFIEKYNYYQSGKLLNYSYRTGPLSSYLTYTIHTPHWCSKTFYFFLEFSLARQFVPGSSSSCFWLSYKKSHFFQVSKARTVQL